MVNEIFLGHTAGEGKDIWNALMFRRLTSMAGAKWPDMNASGGERATMYYKMGDERG